MHAAPARLRLRYRILTGSSEISGDRAEPTAAYLSSLREGHTSHGRRGCNRRAHCVVRGSREMDRAYLEPVAAPGRGEDRRTSRMGKHAPPGEAGLVTKGEAAPRRGGEERGALLCVCLCGRRGRGV